MISQNPLHNVFKKCHTTAHHQKTLEFQRRLSVHSERTLFQKENIRFLSSCLGSWETQPCQCLQQNNFPSEILHLAQYGHGGSWQSVSKHPCSANDWKMCTYSKGMYKARQHFPRHRKGDPTWRTGRNFKGDEQEMLW